MFIIVITIIITKKEKGTVPFDRGGEGTKKVNTGRLRPEVRPLTLLSTIFGRKDTCTYRELDGS